MQENNSLNAISILKKLKKSLKISTDIQLSEFLNVKPNTISTWKKRNSLDYSSIISICELYEIDLNEIFLEGRVTKKEYAGSVSDTPLISREVQFQYCIGGNAVLEGFPKYNFPFVNSDQSRAFQVISNNMFPIIEENSFAICESSHIDLVEDNSLVVIVSRAKGLFINRIRKTSSAESFILNSENAFFNDVKISLSEIDELWLIKSVISYNINNENKVQFINDSLKKIDKVLSKI